MIATKGMNNMPKYGFVINVDRCNGCYACFLACKDEYTGNDHFPTAAATAEGMNLLKVNEIEYGTGSKVKVDYVSIPCQHCDNPVCADLFPESFYKRGDGLVILDPAKASDRELTRACPYGCVTWNEDSGVAQKCNGCAHMLDAGEKVTRCSECCPNQALIFGDLSDPGSEISRFVAEHEDELEQFQPQFGTNPSVRYMYLPKPFICGEVIADGECCKGAAVTVTCDEDGTEYATETDFLGDFEVRQLPTNRPFTVRIVASGYKSAELKCRTMAAVNLGEICLEK